MFQTPTTGSCKTLVAIYKTTDMKIIKILLTLTLWLSFQISSGQITLDYSDNNNTYGLGWTFYPVDIDNNETKYFFMDTVNNQFTLYNMNFTPFMSNIQIPGSYNVNYSVMYLSRRLFDCDSSNIEYMYSAPFVPSSTLKILRTNGNVLFSKDSTIALYSIGALGGSNDMRPIRKTSAGTKMFLGKYVPSNTNNNIQNQVYSLCGALPQGYAEIFNPLVSAAKVYPNPTTNEVVFEINIPSNVSKYDLTLYDLNGKTIIKVQDLKSNRHSLDISAFNSGVYFYSLTSDNKPFATGKIVSTK